MSGSRGPKNEELPDAFGYQMKLKIQSLQDPFYQKPQLRPEIGFLDLRSENRVPDDILDSMTDDAYDRRFDVDCEVPREVWILETRRRDDGNGEPGKWQPFVFPLQSERADDGMAVNTKANIRTQIAHWKECVRSIEWEMQGRLYGPVEVVWDDIDGALPPGGRIPGKIIHEDAVK